LGKNLKHFIVVEKFPDDIFSFLVSLVAYFNNVPCLINISNIHDKIMYLDVTTRYVYTWCYISVVKNAHLYKLLPTYRCTVLFCVCLVYIKIKRSAIFDLVENIFNINVTLEFCYFARLNSVLFRYKIAPKFLVHPTSHSHQYYDKRLYGKPRHQYQQPLMYQMGMDGRRRNANKNSMLIINNQNKYCVFLM
jgi:hypothetical protein